MNLLFNAEDRKRILGMVLRCRNEEEEFIWNRSRYGQYSVRSAYYGAMNELIDNLKLRIAGDWMLIWKLQVPHKVGIHLWRTTKNVLPCCYNLRRRHVPCPSECMLCEAADDTE